METVGIQRNAIEEIEFLTRSPVRVSVLYALLREGPVSKRELKDELDGVRTTVQRNLNALEERGWIEYTTNGYEITSCGRLVANALLDLVDRTTLAIKLRPAIRWIDTDEVDLEFEHFQDADVIKADSTNPYAPIDEQIDLLRRSVSVRVVFPTLNRGLLAQSLRLAESSGTDLEMIVTEDAAKRFRADDRYADTFESLVEQSRVYTHADLPLYLAVTDEEIQLGSTDTDNVVRVLLEFNNAQARTWASEEFEEYRQSAHRLG